MIRDLAPVLSHNTTIKSFDFSIYSSFKPDPKAIAELAEALKNNKSITSFRSEIKCEFEGTKFAEIFKANTTITSLYFYTDQAHAPAVSELFEALKTNTSITSFSVCGNGVEAVELVDVLKTNKSLKHLIVNSSVMKNDDSMTLFSQALATNTTLASFKMAKYLTKVGAGKLTEGLRVNTGLKHFGVTADGYSEEGTDLVLMNGIATVLNENQTLNSLMLSFSVSDKISEFFFESLEKNTTLDSITLRIGNVKQIAGVIGKNNTLTSIDFQGGQLKAQELQEIVDALKQNTTLSTLYIPRSLFIMKKEELTSMDNLHSVLSTNDNLLYFTNNFTISHFPKANDWVKDEINKRLNHNNLKFDKFAEFLASNSLIKDEQANVVAKINTENSKFFNFTYTKFLNYSQTYIKMVLFICHLMATFKAFLDTCDQETR